MLCCLDPCSRALIPFDIVITEFGEWSVSLYTSHALFVSFVCFLYLFLFLFGVRG